MGFCLRISVVLTPIDIGQVDIHKNEIWPLGFRQCNTFFTALGLYRLVSKFCYELTEDLTRVLVIFHDENFLLHMTSVRLGNLYSG
jgi:hypothetical protein